MLDLDENPCPECVTALHQMHASAEPMDMGQLVNAIAAEFGWDALGAPDSQRCPACGQLHDDLLGIPGFLDDWDEGEHDAAGHAADLVLGMLDFGAVAADGGVVKLTRLGFLLAESVYGKHAVPADANAAAVVSATAGIPPAAAVTLAGPWLSARLAPDAARQLIAFAESAWGGERIAALAFARTLGTEAADAWRELAMRPGIGAYGRQWLSEQDEPVISDRPMMPG